MTLAALKSRVEGAVGDMRPAVRGLLGVVRAAELVIALGRVPATLLCGILVGAVGDRLLGVGGNIVGTILGMAGGWFLPELLRRAASWLGLTAVLALHERRPALPAVGRATPVALPSGVTGDAVGNDRG